MRLPALVVLIAALPCLSFGPPAHACIWDRDTLAMERARFPEANELIAGYFARHSEHYYRWRLDQITAIPNSTWTPADYDDLAASYDKLGDPQRAIELMREKIERFPDQGRYESQANLGTFLIHAGELEEGLVHIENAIAINPDAHFGREVYQKLLVEYVLERRAAGAALPLEEEEVGLHPRGRGFGWYVLNQQGIPDNNTEIFEEVDRAIQGVIGMMRFGHYDSPILLEALGDLLILDAEGTNGMQRMAARAYLKASYKVDTPDEADRYRYKAKIALHVQQNDWLEQLEPELKEEIAQGDAYFAQIEADERGWAASGKDLDAEFARVYYEAPSFETPMIDKLGTTPVRSWAMFILVGGVIAAVSVVALTAVLRKASRQAHATG